MVPGSDITYELPDTVRLLLIKLTDVAKRNHTLIVECKANPRTRQDAANYTIIDKDAITDPEFKQLEGEPLQCLLELGLVSRASSGDHDYFLHPAAFQRADYETSSMFSQWLQRQFYHLRETMTGVALGLSIVATLLSIIATIVALTRSCGAP